MKQEYKVMQSFAVTGPISGAQRHLSAGEMVVCDINQPGSTLTLEVGEGAFTAYLLVERTVFEACCKWIPRGMA